MPHASHRGIRIHYETEGEGPPLLLHHGFTSHLMAWRYYGYVQKLKAHHRVIMLDARGHGHSDKPHTPGAYAMQERVGDVLAVLDAAGVEQVHYFGYSMGGRIGFALAGQAPERLLSLAIGGAHPYPDERFDAFKKVDGSDVDAFIAALEKVIDEKLPREMKLLLAGQDLRAFSAAAKVMPPMETALPKVTMPCLMFAGDHDGRHDLVKRCAESLAHARFVSLPGLNHMSAVSRSAEVVPLLLDFLRMDNRACP